MKHVIALDVGGTGMKPALVGPDGTLLYEDRRPTPREQGAAAVVASIMDFTASLKREGERRFDAPADGAGVVVPGMVDEQGGIAVLSANLGWRDLPIRALLTAHLDLSIALGHGVRAGALAELRLGAGRGVEHLLFIALGTGIAGGIGLGHTIEAGAHGFAGEIGHVIVRPDGPACGCGARGCLEAVAAAVTRAWQAASGNDGGTAADCSAAVDAGDSRAVAVWHDAVAALADGIVMVQSLLDPETVVIGGGLAEAGETLFTPLRAAVAQRLTFQTPPALVPAMLRDKAGCHGAGVLAWDMLRAKTAN